MFGRMRVTVSVNGRFHAFELAAELQRRGHLSRLITTYPTSKAAEWGIPREKIATLLPLELIRRLAGFFSKGIRRYLIALQRELYDRVAASAIPAGTDVFVGWSGSTLCGIRRAKASGAVTILERGSCHILTQLELLREEHRRHNSVFEEHHSLLTRKELTEYEEAAYISIPSRFAKRTFLERGICSQKLIQIPYGVDLSCFKPMQRDDDVFRLIHCGGISLQKGLPYLLQAFSELGLRNSELWLIGAPSKETRRALRRYDNKNIHNRGSFRQVELPKQYAQGSVLCLASIQEGFGMVLLQAMACGLPVICTTNSAGEDLVRDGKEGFIVPIRDVKALKDRILYLYENPGICLAMGRSAIARASGEFSWDDYGERITSTYHRILSGMQ